MLQFPAFMNRPNLLATKRGRLITFFFLYLTEGIPLGFVATAVATQLRRRPEAHARPLLHPHGGPHPVPGPCSQAERMDHARGRGAVDRPLAPQAVITAFWIAVLVYSVFQGLMYGSRTALFMDVTNPAVAATQFTAYMALMNLTISYSAAWQGWWIERFGYPGTLLVDALFGLVCIATLPLMSPRRKRLRTTTRP